MKHCTNDLTSDGLVDIESDRASGQVSDSALERLRDGDPEVLGELFDRYRQRLLHIIQIRMDRRLAARVDAEDVLQEIYLDAASRVQYYIQNHSGSFFIWLRLIATQTMANFYRRHLNTQMRDVRRDISISAGKASDSPTRPIAMQLIGHLTSPSRAAIRRESIQQLETAISSLRPVDREVIALRHFELLDNKEVAEILCIREKAASIRYIRAIKRLKDSLNAGADEESKETSDVG